MKVWSISRACPASDTASSNDYRDLPILHWRCGFMRMPRSWCIIGRCGNRCKRRSYPFALSSKRRHRPTGRPPSRLQRDQEAGLSLWKRNRDAEAGNVAGEGNGGAMEIGHCDDQGQAEAAARGDAAAFEPIKASEDVPRFRLGSRGRYRPPSDAVPPSSPEIRKRGVRRCLADGVLDQIGEHLGQEVAVAADGGSRRQPSGR